mgnify:CR=1 FL=1
MVTGDALSQLLERRLDNTIYRAGFALTRAQSRQMATHGMFIVNGRRVDVPSYQLSPGDVIEVRPSKKSSLVFGKVKDTQPDYVAPSWIKADIKKLQAEILELPDERHFDAIVETRLIVEFYSR